MPAPECRFKLQLSTALFMYGANNWKPAEPELRPSGIVGVLRYWLRAVAAGITDSNGIRTIEAELLGSDDQEIGQRLIILAPGAAGLKGEEKFLLPHKPHKNTHEKKSKEKRSPKRALIGSHCFEIVLRAHGAPLAAERIEILSAVLWLAIHLGGFGQRARRGAGSLQVLDSDTSPSQVRIPESPTVLSELIGQKVAVARDGILNWKQNLALAPSKTPPYPVLASDCAQIVVARLDIQKEEEARRKIMVMRESVDEPEHDDPAFGGTGKKRFASPLHVHIGPWGPSDEYAFVVATWFRESKPIKSVGTPDPEKVKKFLTKLGGVDVSLPPSRTSKSPPSPKA